jgi:hypothetical protein
LNRLSREEESYKLASESMRLEQETAEPMEQREAGNVGDARLRSAKVRKRVKEVFIIVLMALFSIMYFYFRSAYLRRAGDWRLFWIGESVLGVWVVVALVKAFRTKSKSQV